VDEQPTADAEHLIIWAKGRRTDAVPGDTEPKVPSSEVPGSGEDMGGDPLEFLSGQVMVSMKRADGRHSSP